METMEERVRKHLPRPAAEKLINSPALQCHRCTHGWARRDWSVEEGRYVKLPDKCPNCDSPYWAWPVVDEAKSEGARDYHRELKREMRALKKTRK